MKYTVNLSIVAILSASSAWAATTTPYYEYEILSPDTDESNFGPYASAIDDTDDNLFSVYGTKARLDQDLDLGLPFTFNQECFYDDEVCEVIYYGSESSSDLSFENAYQDWRNAMANIDNGATPSSYFIGATNDVKVEGFGDDTDVKITDVVDLDSGSFAVGYGSAPYSSGSRDFVRRGFIVDSGNGNIETTLLPEFEGDVGGFTSAYKMRKVTIGGIPKTLIVGNSSKSWAGGNSTYFNNCFNDGDEKDIDELNNLVYCPGFDTQAWAWEYDGTSSELNGFALATEWLDGNTANNSKNLTYSAAALDINNDGIAVGVSTFNYTNKYYGGRQRAIIMTPDSAGVYSKPTELTDATSGVGDEEDSLYNTWAQTITDENVVMGNRQYEAVKGRNKPIEMFIYDIDKGRVSFPFLDKKVLSTKQRLAGDSSSKSGASSRGYDMNENGLVVGKADAYDQDDPVVGGVPRRQSAFLYDHSSGDSWYLEDLLCSADAGGTVINPLIRLESATAINENGVILAQGYQYSNNENYQLSIGATPIFVKLTPDLASTPNDSPNCWNSAALASVDESFSRSGAASLWLWILALPLLILRKIKNNK